MFLQEQSVARRAASFGFPFLERSGGDSLYEKSSWLSLLFSLCFSTPRSRSPHRRRLCPFLSVFGSSKGGGRRSTNGPWPVVEEKSSSLLPLPPFLNLNPALPLPGTAAATLAFNCFLLFPFSKENKGGSKLTQMFKTEQKKGKKRKTKARETRERGKRARLHFGENPASNSSSSSLNFFSSLHSLSPLLVGGHGLDRRLRLRPKHRLHLSGDAPGDQVQVALALRRDAPALLGSVGRLLDDADGLELLQDVADEAARGEGVPLRGAAAGLVAAAIGAAEGADAQALLLFWRGEGVAVSFFPFLRLLLRLLWYLPLRQQS